MKAPHTCTNTQLAKAFFLLSLPLLPFLDSVVYPKLCRDLTPDHLSRESSVPLFTQPMMSMYLIRWSDNML